MVKQRNKVKSKPINRFSKKEITKFFTYHTKVTRNALKRIQELQGLPSEKLQLKGLA